jgi:hypothetical protein
MLNVKRIILTNFKLFHDYKLEVLKLHKIISYKSSLENILRAEKPLLKGFD